jgi:hypothetical protein
MAAQRQEKTEARKKHSEGRYSVRTEAPQTVLQACVRILVGRYPSTEYTDQSLSLYHTLRYTTHAYDIRTYAGDQVDVRIYS